MTKRKELPRRRKSHTIEQLTDHGKMYVTISHNRLHNPTEIFINIGHTEPCDRAWMEALGRAVSIGLQYGVPMEEYINQFKGISCQPISNGHGEFVKSPADGLAKVLEEFGRSK